MTQGERGSAAGKFPLWLISISNSGSQSSWTASRSWLNMQSVRFLAQKDISLSEKNPRCSIGGEMEGAWGAW